MVAGMDDAPVLLMFALAMGSLHDESMVTAQWCLPI